MQQPHKGYKIPSLTFEVNEQDDGYHVILIRKGSSGRDLGIAFPFEDYATKAGQAILDYSFFKPFETVEPEPEKKSKAKATKKTTTRKAPPTTQSAL